ncbi:MAG: hypothetical protein WBL85_04555 [Sedimentisphaerales bacterium]
MPASPVTPQLHKSINSNICPCAPAQGFVSPENIQAALFKYQSSKIRVYGVGEKIKIASTAPLPSFSFVVETLRTIDCPFSIGIAIRDTIRIFLRAMFHVKHAQNS